VFVGDANNDGYNDILSSDWSDDTVTIYNGTASGGWEPKFNLSVGDEPYCVFVGDANNDGYNDILTADDADWTISIYNGTNNNNWEPRMTLDVVNGPEGLFVGDANNDGYNDVVSAESSPDLISIFRGKSDNYWEARTTLSTTNGPYYVIVADANNDGLNDIINTDYFDDSITIFNGTSDNSWETKYALGVGDQPRDFGVGNLNNDLMGGSIDVSRADVVLTGEAAGDKFGYSVSLAGDIDGDGYPDIAVGAPYHTNESATECGALYIFSGGFTVNTTAAYTNYGEYAYDHFGWSVSHAGDIDGNGLMEVICGAPHYNTTAGETPPSAEDVGKVYCYTGFLIPEFSEILVPIVFMLLIIAIWRRRRIKKTLLYENRKLQNNYPGNGYNGSKGVQMRENKT
jgi:hypothetical protein